MPDVDWRLDGRIAELRCGPLAALADLAAPNKGLTDVRWHALPLASWQVLGVEVDPLAAQTASSLADRYQRGGDLVTTYEQTAARPLRVQVYWRAALMNGAEHELAIIDLQVSVQTNLLDGRSAIATASRFTECECTELRVGKQDDEDSLVQLFRPTRFDFSYAEMIHPADFHGVESTALADGSHWRRAKLFGGPLEKGVILRARMRGVFLPRSHDTVRAAAAFDDFLRQPPPLTT
jgi:hypothetical protein